MKKARFTESQIVASIKKQESGTPVREISREMGISEATFYNNRRISYSWILTCRE
jgi:putative transposase